MRSLGTRGSQTAARGAGLWSQCPASGAEKFTALLMLTRYFSPQLLLLSSHVSLLCCVSQRPLTQKESTSQCLVCCYYSEFPISRLRECFRSLTGCMDVRSSGAVPAVSRGFVPGAKVCGCHHPGGRLGPEPPARLNSALVLTDPMRGEPLAVPLYWLKTMRISALLINKCI